MTSTTIQTSIHKFQITVSKDSMAVNLIIKKPQPNDFLPSIDDILSSIEADGINIGVNQETIEKILTENNYNNPVQIAEGIKPIKGKNSEFKYNFDIVQDHKPQVDNNGHIDYKNINFIQNIEKDGLLATRTSAQQGTPGKNVYGKEIKGPDGRNLPFKNGANTEVSEDGNSLTASCSGAIVFLHNKISVNDVMVIKEDVDFNVGNLDCRGSVRVNGNIKTGFTVKTDGDLEVNGNVEDADIDVKGNIMIKGGFFGKGTGVMKAGGEVYLKFAEGQTIIAGSNIIIGGEALNCNIESQGNVIIKGPKGKIIGGVTKAKKEIQASYLGSDSGTTTKLIVAYDTRLVTEYKRCNDEIDRLTADGDRIKDVIVGLVRLKIDKKISTEQEEVLKKLKNFRNELPENLKKLESEKEELIIEIQKLDDAQIIAEKIVYPGVKASFGLVYREFNKENKKCVIRLVNGQIYISEYVAK